MIKCSITYEKEALELTISHMVCIHMFLFTSHTSCTIAQRVQEKVCFDTRRLWWLVAFFLLIRQRICQSLERDRPQLNCTDIECSVCVAFHRISDHPVSTKMCNYTRCIYVDSIQLIHYVPNLLLRYFHSINANLVICLWDALNTTFVLSMYAER